MTAAAQAGLFVTVDGVGGAGKSTIITTLQHELLRRGHRVHTTAEPSASALGQLTRAGADTYRGHALACLVAADRYHHLTTEIRPHLARGDTVLCDRYVPSSYVLQRMDGVPTDTIAAINAAADRPDLAVILTTDPAVATDRVRRRGVHSRFENGLDTARTETELYRDTIRTLSALGWPLLVRDTTDTPPQQLATHIADRLAGGG